MKKIKKEYGITLVALVITIIILLILAGISIAKLTENGLFQKAKLSREKTENSQDEENNKLVEYENYVNEYLVGANRNNEELKMKSCNIEISDMGILKVKNVEKIFAFTIVKDGKCFDITKGDTYSINIQIDQKANIYVIAIDEDANLYKSNVVEFTKKGTYLYNYGNENSTITSGWKGVVQDSRNCKYSSLSDSLYMHTTSSTYSLSAITTNTKIDITGYNYLCCEIINSDDLSSGYTAKFGISKENTNHYPALAKYLTTTIDSNKKVYKLDIRDVTGEYYPVITGVMEMHLYKMWLE